MRITFSSRKTLTFIILLIALIALTAQAQAISVKISKYRTLNLNARGVFFSNDTAIAYNSNYIFAYNASRILWKKSLSITTASAAGKYIAVAGKKEVILLDSDGRQLWKRSVKGYVTTVSVSRTGLVAVGTDAGILYLFNNRSELVWEYTLKGCVKSVSCRKDFVVASDVYGNIYYFKKFGRFPWSFTDGDSDLNWIYRTGWCIWKFDGLSSLCKYPSIVVKCVGRNVLAVSKFMRYAYLFTDTGYEIWNWSFCGSPISVSAGKNVFGIGSGDKLYVFNANGRLLWTLDFKEPVVFGISENGNFTAVSSGKLVFLLNTSGKLLWTSSVPESLKCVAVSNSGKVAGGADNSYYFTPGLIAPVAPARHNANSTVESHSESVKLSGLNKTAAKTPIEKKTQKQKPDLKLKKKSETSTAEQKTSKTYKGAFAFNYLYLLPAIAGAVVVLKLKSGAKPNKSRKARKTKKVSGSKKKVKGKTKEKAVKAKKKTGKS